MTLSVRLIASPAELAALTQACMRLVTLMRPQLPFATVVWLNLWWQHFHEARLLLVDKFFVHGLFDQQGTLVALAPMMLSERPGDGPLRFRALRFIGGDKNITELRGLICAPEHEALAVRSLVAHLAANSDAWDWFAWEGIHEGGEAHAVLSRLDNFHWTREITDHVLALPSSWEEFRTTRSRNIKESLRKCYNSLKRDGHDFELRVLSQPQELKQGLERFFELHRRRAAAVHMADHADYFRPAPARNLLLGLADSPDSAPRLRIFELCIGGSVVATRLGFLMNDELYLYFSGFEPEWARYSVMTTTLAEVIKWAILHGLRAVNLSTGTDVSKTRWGPERVVRRGGILISPRRTAWLKWEVMSELERRIRSGSSLSHLVNVARRRA